VKQRLIDLCQITDKLFADAQPIRALWQELADNFYVERADFTTSRTVGEDYASHLMSGGPAMIRRELADQIAAMIRPPGEQWFKLRLRNAEQESAEADKWADRTCEIMYAAMYDTDSNFARACKVVDNDYVTFGQGVMTVEVDEENTSLIYRPWHLRDMAWKENDRMKMDYITRNWKIQARDMCNNPRYQGKVDAKVEKAAKDEPFKEINCRHIILPYDEYDYTPEGGRKPKEGRFQFMSLLIDRDNEKILEEVPLYDHPYIIPRWQTVSGSQYAHSPATVIALPDARVLQAITSTLLEAGEKATNPPMVATQQALRSDISLYAGGITWVDAEYNEKQGAALAPVNMDWSGLKFGYEMADKHEEMIRQAFYLNKILLPPYDGKAMTATEVRTRTEEYIRSALPLFEPIEADYAGQLCEKTFNLLLRYGTFGNPREWPQELSGADMKWKFESPLAEAKGRKGALQFQETAALLLAAAEIDPALKGDWDYREDWRQALKGLGASMVDEEDADAAREQADQMAQIQNVIGMVGQGGAAAAEVGKAAESFAGAGVDMAAAQQGGV
jgi:hypothetical protein